MVYFCFYKHKKLILLLWINNYNTKKWPELTTKWPANRTTRVFQIRIRKYWICILDIPFLHHLVLIQTTLVVIIFVVWFVVQLLFRYGWRVVLELLEKKCVLVNVKKIQTKRLRRPPIQNKNEKIQNQNTQNPNDLIDDPNSSNVNETITVIDEETEKNNLPRSPAPPKKLKNPSKT